MQIFLPATRGSGRVEGDGAEPSVPRMLEMGARKGHPAASLVGAALGVHLVQWSDVPTAAGMRAPPDASLFFSNVVRSKGLEGCSGRAVPGRGRTGRFCRGDRGGGDSVSGRPRAGGAFSPAGFVRREGLILVLSICHLPEALLLLPPLPDTCNAGAENPLPPGRELQHLPNLPAPNTERALFLHVSSVPFCSKGIPSF